MVIRKNLPFGFAAALLRLPSRGLVGLTTTAVVASLAWLVWTGQATHDEMQAASRKAVRVAELRGTIAYLESCLTMSAQMAAATGEPRWAEQYDEAAPKLDAAIGEAADLATPEVRTALRATTQEAHRDLSTMERRALALAAGGDLPAARALLDGPEFSYLQDVYASGVDAFSGDLKTLADTRASELNDRAWLEAAGLGLSAVLLVATASSILGRRRLRGAVARTAAVARTDALTDLPNRHRFYEDLAATLAGRGSSDLALLSIDLDRFKAANDAYGHAAGDQVLRLVSSRLQSGVRASDLIARLGGDEFAVLVRFEAGEPAGEPAMVAARIVAALSEPFTLDDGATVRIGASVGIALAEPIGETIGGLMHRADVALSRAKADGRGCVRFFEEGMDADVRARALLEGELRQAIADDAIVPHFQPLVAIATGRLIGVEMLARWPHPTRGMVSPVAFIPIAEDLGLIGTMTERLLFRACRAAAQWPDDITLACNISPLQLRDPNLPAMIKAVLGGTGFPASRLELEVTESALVGDLDLARALLGQLKSLGVRLALDDFGTGYSSLRHLQTLPFDKIKIDRSFIGAMSDDKESGKIVSAVIGLSHSLGLLTVAEGVETAETAALLRELGCDIGQGWLFGRPSPANVIDAVLRPAAPIPATVATVATAA